MDVKCRVVSVNSRPTDHFQQRKQSIILLYKGPPLGLNNHGGWGGLILCLHATAHAHRLAMSMLAGGGGDV